MVFQQDAQLRAGIDAALGGASFDQDVPGVLIITKNIVSFGVWEYAMNQFSPSSTSRCDL